MTTNVQDINRVTTATPLAESARPHEPRRHDTWSVGDKALQGDLILVALAKMPRSAKPRANRQLADGNTTGSRHILAGGEVFDADKSELSAMILRSAKMTVDARYIGPVFAGECVVEHPQHQDQCFPDHAATVVVYQRDLDAEERERRVLD